MATGISLESLSDRVWFAWNCLPRTNRGKPPSWKQLEKDFEISGATFSKLVSGERSTVDSDTLGKLAQALNVTTDWLTKRKGDDPTPTGPVRSREKRFDAYDPSTFVAKYDAIGGALIERPNPFQVAVLYHGRDIDKSIVEALAKEAAGREETRTAIGWGRELIERQNKRSAATPPKPRKKKLGSEPASPRRKAG